MKTLWVLGVLALVAATAAAFAIVNAPQLRVRSVSAEIPAGSPVSVSDVVAAAHVDPQSNVWLLDTAGIRTRIEALPYVDGAAVYRAQFPQPAVTLRITLRRPDGCVRSAQQTVTIDALARVLQTGCAATELPLIDLGSALLPAPGQMLAGEDVGRLLEDARTIGATLPVRLVRRDRFGGVEAVDDDGIVLKFGGDRDLPAKLALVEPVRRSIDPGRRLTAIDLREPATPVVDFR